MKADAFDALAHGIGTAIGEGMPSGVRFALVLFDRSHGGMATCVTNAGPQEVVELLRFALERMESDMAKGDGA